MGSTLAGQVLAALSAFSSHTRLYELTFLNRRGDPGLLVEAFASDEQLQGIAVRDLIALSTRANIAHSSLLGQEVSLEISLADRTRSCFSGYISQVATLGSDGGLSRYRLRLSPWIWLLTHWRNSRAWQDSSVIETKRPVPKLQLPRLQIKLDSGQHDANGVQQTNSLTTEQAMALWEWITSSIRLRSAAAE